MRLLQDLIVIRIHNKLEISNIDIMTKGPRKHNKNYPKEGGKSKNFVRTITERIDPRNSFSQQGGKPGFKKHNHPRQHSQQYDGDTEGKPGRFIDRFAYKGSRKESVPSSHKSSNRRQRHGSTVTSLSHQNPFVAKLREQAFAFNQSPLELENAEIIDQREVFQPSVPVPKFGYEKDWTEDDFLIKFITSAVELNALHTRILSYSEPEQFGVLKYLFTSETAIPVGRYSSNGAFQISHHLNDLIQAEDTIKRLIVISFYTNNTFLFQTVDELTCFVMSTPWESLLLIRRVALSSNTIRRKLGERESNRRHATQADFDVANALKRIPHLDKLYVLLGYDIKDSYYQWITTDGWCASHPNLPSLEYHRSEEQTPPGFEVSNLVKETIHAEDQAFLIPFQLQQARFREIKAMKMDTKQ